MLVSRLIITSDSPHPTPTKCSRSKPFLSQPDLESRIRALFVEVVTIPRDSIFGEFERMETTGWRPKATGVRGRRMHARTADEAGQSGGRARMVCGGGGRARSADAVGERERWMRRGAGGRRMRQGAKGCADSPGDTRRRRCGGRESGWCSRTARIPERAADVQGWRPPAAR